MPVIPTTYFFVDVFGCDLYSGVCIIRRCFTLVGFGRDIGIQSLLVVLFSKLSWLSDSDHVVRLVMKSCF